MKAKEIGAFEAKTHLSEVLEEVRKGRTFVITKRGRAVAELRPASTPGRRLRYGCDKGSVVIGSDFDAPLADMKEYLK